MDIRTIIPLVSTFLSLSVAFITFLLKSIKNEKAKKILQQTVKITENLQQFVANAEQFVNYTGLEKKEYVMTKVNQLALDNKMRINQDEISRMIDELVELTKKVNVNSNNMSSETIEVVDKNSIIPIVSDNNITNKLVL